MLHMLNVKGENIVDSTAQTVLHPLSDCVIYFIDIDQLSVMEKNSSIPCYFYIYKSLLKI